MKQAVKYIMGKYIFNNLLYIYVYSILFQVIHKIKIFQKKIIEQILFLHIIQIELHFLMLYHLHRL